VRTGPKRRLPGYAAGRVDPAGGRVLDVACGQGRHLRYLQSLGFAVVGVDRDAQALSALGDLNGAEVASRTSSGAWPFAPGGFDGVVVTNYLHRPIFPIWSARCAPAGC